MFSAIAGMKFIMTLEVSSKLECCMWAWP